MPKIKVTHIITQLELGGAQRNTLYTVSHLDRNRFECQLLSGPGGILDQEAKKLASNGPQISFISGLIRSVRPWKELLAIFQIKKELTRFRPDIVHTHSSKAGILGRWAALWARVPVVIHTYHGFGFNNQQKPWVRKFFIFLEKITAHWTAKLIVVSKANKTRALSLNIGQPDQYVLIRSGIKKPTSPLSRESVQTLKTSLGIPQNIPIIITIGPFKPQKNLQDFLRLAKSLTNFVPGCRFLMVGDGEERPGLEAIRKELGLEKLVVMAGWRSDVAELLSASDVFVLTSLWEGLPRSLVEAMSLGLPVVCYNTDGVADIIQHQKNGFLFRPGQIDLMAAQIATLLRDRSLHQRIGQAAASSIQQEFDINLMVKQQEALYEELLTGTPRV